MPPQPAQPDPPSDSTAPERDRGITPEEIGRLPELPGVYIMHDSAGKVIYIGKARNLNARVHSYFTKSGDIRFNVRYLLRHVTRIETIITANEKEAFLLENTLIKKHQPRYNIRLRDDKTYVSIRIDTAHAWPRAVVMRRRGAGEKKDSAVYLGPYASAASVRNTLRHLQRIFPIRSCTDAVLNNRSRPCMLHSIGRCCAPCVKPVDKLEYGEMVRNTILFLKGKTGEVVQRLERQMSTAAEDMQFETAAVLRDRIRAIEATTERQGVHSHDKQSDQDVITIDRDGGYASFVVFVYRNGLLTSSRPFIVQDYGRREADLMAEFLVRYYEIETPPREILLDPVPDEADGLAEWLGERREGPCALLNPQRGERRRLIETAHENGKKLLAQHLAGEKTVEQMLDEIAEKLHLPGPPEVIECFDISTIQGFATVGSMVTFRMGEPDKNRYRKFRIKSFEGQDDFAAMHEVLTRRFRKVMDGEEESPGLVVIDGGKGQLAQAVAVFEEMGLSHIPVAGMAKARVKRRGDTVERTEERFFLPGRKNPVTFRDNAPALFLLVRLRDEAHRFGVTYHRELRKKLNLRSGLEDIPGVGKTLAGRLLRHFGSMKRLREATAEEIAGVEGVSAGLAANIQGLVGTAQDEAEAATEADEMDISSDEP